MSVRAWVPLPEMLDDLPPELPGDVYDGRTLPDSADEVEFYVLPYMVGPASFEVMAKLPRLRVAQTLTAGVDAMRPYVPAGVTLCNARGLHDAANSELAVTLILAALNRIPESVRAAATGEWTSGLRPGLADRTVLIVGYGSIGAAIERRLAPFECEVLRVARTPRDGVSGIDDLPELLPRADVVLLQMPATDETRGMVDAAFLARMRDGALLVNMARGNVVVTDALVAELASGRLAAATDVTDPEPLPPGHPLWTLPNVIITPHIGGASGAFLPRARRIVREQAARFAAGEPLRNVIEGTY